MSVATDWFLTDDEIERHRTPAYTTRNSLYIEREGDLYFGDLFDEFAAAGKGTNILIAGWRFSPEQKLRPRTSPQTIVEALTKATTNGSVVRAMACGSAFATTISFQVPGLPSKDNSDFVRELRDAHMAAILDNRLASAGSQHQKAVVISRRGPDSAAYVGGIDVCVERYDTVVHDFRSERQTEPLVVIPLPHLPAIIINASQPGWHDAQAVVHGPAVGQVWQALVDRWNDPAPIFGPAPTPIPARDAPAKAEGNSTFAVQVLRTVPCNGIFRSLPKGEQTVRTGCEKAIRAAQHYIYIEDQYFWPSPVMDALRDAVGRGVQVIAVVARDYDIPGSSVHKQMRARTAAHIAQRQPKNFRIFHKERLKTADAIYVHSKLMIIDDRYLAVGTANVNWRSHTNDTELHLGVFDENLVNGTIAGQPVQVGDGIRALRQSLWAEHLDMSPDGLYDPIDALQYWPSKPGQKVGQAVWHELDAIGGNADAFREVLRLLLRMWQTARGWETLAVPLLAPAGIVLSQLPRWGQPDFDLGSVADRIPAPAAFVENVLLNPRLICR